MSQKEKATLLRELPSVDELLRTPAMTLIADTTGKEAAVRVARSAIEATRSRVIAGGSVGNREELLNIAVGLAEDAFSVSKSSRIRPVINATGVIIHTNLGRSVLSADARQALEGAAGYCTLEYDVEAGRRGKRGAGAEAMLCDLTGAESALIVNNCAGAAFLVLRVLASGREVVISRGELVEIGGDFRIPDVLVESGAILREVGTTNRTKLADYERAVSSNTGLLMRVHPSNYRIVGFTESPSLAEMSELARQTGVPLFEDAGSGALVDLSELGLDEPTIGSSIADGADLIAFSGDKLLGGVQAGFVAGRRDLIEAIRRHPLYRAFRVDKLAYAAIEATLGAYARGKHVEEIPTLKMLSLDTAFIRSRAEDLVQSVAKTVAERLQLTVVEGESVIGGGAAPNVRLGTWLVHVDLRGRSANQMDDYFRSRTRAVIGRIADERYLLDMRTVDPSEEPEIRAAIEALADHAF